MRVVLLMGGSSTERDISFVTGRGVGKALHSRGHEVIALDPATGKRLALTGVESAQIGTSPGVAARDVGKERSLVLAKSADLTGADVVFIALHGAGTTESAFLDAYGAGHLRLLADSVGFRYVYDPKSGTISLDGAIAISTSATLNKIGSGTMTLSTPVQRKVCFFTIANAPLQR
jgi:D-alanine-D-alanine ligase-like ATP-grasp enzyme